MHDFDGTKVLLGISGGIAAYKSAYLVRELMQLGASVRVIMTDSATQFISPLTFQALTGQPVRTQLVDAEAEEAMGHIGLARWADVFVIAPASANCIAKLAHGLADDLLSTLALVATIPCVICPAMNQSMWSHPATQANYQTLRARGVVFCGPQEGMQACGEYGLGRMSEPQAIINALRLHGVHGVLDGREVVITAGPTREPIDPVRYVSNRSSGKMGYALAEAAAMAGARVTLISGPVACLPPAGVHVVRVETALAMHEAVMRALVPGSVFIAAAAVGDYRVASPLLHKLKKQGRTQVDLTMVTNPDIVAEAVDANVADYVVAFAAETQDMLLHARHKLQSKSVDMLIANQVGPEQGFDVDENEVIVLTAAHETPLPRQHKVRLAASLIAIIAANLHNSA